MLSPVDAPVDLDGYIRAESSFSDCATLLQGGPDELLSAEARVDRHHQYEVDKIGDLQHSGEVGTRIEGHSRTRPEAQRSSPTELRRWEEASACTLTASAPALTKAST